MAEPTTSSPLLSLKPLAGRALQGALNRLVALDPDTATALRRLDGRRIRLALEAPALALQIRVRDGVLEVGPADSAAANAAAAPEHHEPDLSIRATLGGLLAQVPALLGRDPSTVAGVPAGRLRIAGDAELARQLQHLATRFDPDWDRPFAAMFGDVLGVQIARALRGALAFGVSTAGGLARDGAEYLTEETGDVLGRGELDQFHDEVDAVRDRVERLAVRIARADATVRGRA